MTFKDHSHGAGKVEMLRPFRVLHNGVVLASYDDFLEAEEVAAVFATNHNILGKHFEKIPMKGFQGDARVLVIWQDIPGDVISVVGV